MFRACVSILSLLWLPLAAQVKPAIFFVQDTAVSYHKTIAILPFYCIGHPSDFIKAPAFQPIQEKQIGLELQHSLYTLMVSFGDNFSVTIQDLYTTNDLLRKQGFTDFSFTNMQRVAGVLGVDAVLWAVVTHSPVQFLEDDSLNIFLRRQSIPKDAKKKDFFLSLFDSKGACFWTLAANSELLRNLLYFENNRFQLFQWMQEMPYWQGEKIKII